VNLAVTVLHNVARGSFFGFRPDTADLRHAHTFQVVADNVNEAAKLMWLLCNVDGPDDLPAHLSLYAAQVEHYRQRMNRSLSVGDVLVMERLEPEQQFEIAGVMACEVVGWKGLEYVPEYERGANVTATSRSYEAYRVQWDDAPAN